MANTAVAVTALVPNAATIPQLYTGGAGQDAGMVSVSSGNTAVIAALGEARDLVVVVSGDDTHTGSVLLVAGVEPPSESSGLAVPSAYVTIAAGVYILPLLGGQYVQADGTVHILVGGTGPVYIGAYRMSLKQ